MSVASWYQVDQLKSVGQYGALMVTITVTATLSMMGSSGIIYMTSRKGLDNVLRRLLFALSISDFYCSLSLLWNPWLVPKGTPGSYWAIGNEATCSAMGFFTFTGGMFTSFVNCFLSLYFLVSVRYSWSDQYISKHVERWGYGIAVVIPLLPAIGGVVTRSFNPQEYIGICQWDVYPWGCEDNPDLECTGQYSYILGWVSIFLLFSASVIGFVSVYLVYRTVRQRMRAHNRRFSSADLGHSNEESINRAERCKVQAILYALVYFNSFVWPFAAGVLGEMIPPEQYSNAFPYTLLYLCYFFYPLQGLGNFVVYSYPSVQRWRRAEPSLKIRSIVWLVLQGREPGPSRRGSSVTTSRRMRTSMSRTNSKDIDFGVSSRYSNTSQSLGESGRERCVKKEDEPEEGAPGEKTMVPVESVLAENKEVDNEPPTVEASDGED